MELSQLKLEDSLSQDFDVLVVATILSLMDKDPRVMDIALLAIAGYLNGEYPWYPDHLIDDIKADLLFLKRNAETHLSED